MAANVEHLGFDASAADLLFGKTADPMTVLGLRPDGHVEIVAVNPAGAAATGWDPEDVRGRQIGELYPADHAARTEGFVGQLEGPGSIVDYVVDAETAAGRRTYQVRLIGLRVEGELLYALSISHDITRREVAESALDETQRLGRIGHFSWNLESDELTWTEQMYELFGLPAGSVVDVNDVFDRVDEPDSFRQLVDEAVATGGSYELEFWLTRPDGERRLAVARGRAFLGRDGTAVRVSGTTQDVTEQRAAEVAAVMLDRARTRQAQALELNDDVLQGLATVRVALMQDEHDLALQVVDRTLEAARAIISGLLQDQLGAGPLPGDLVRARSSGSSDEG